MSSFVDYLIPINKINSDIKKNELQRLSQDRMLSIGKQCHIVIMADKKDPWRIFQVNKVLLSSKGEEYLINTKGMLATLSIFVGLIMTCLGDYFAIGKILR